MIPRLRALIILMLIILTGLIIAACERPLSPSTDSDELPTPVVVTVESETEATPVEAVGQELEDEQPTVEPAEDVTEEQEGEAENQPEEQPEIQDEEPEDEGSEEPTDTSEEEEEPASDSGDEDSDSETTDAEESESGSDDSEADAEDSSEEETGDGGQSEEGGSEESTDEGEEGENEVSVSEPITHTVTSGENLYRISLIYDVPMLEIAQFNNIENTDAIYAGDVLLIPPIDFVSEEDAENGVDSEDESDENSGAEPSEEEGTDSETDEEEPVEPPSEFTDYTVQPGDTLGLIAQRFGVSWVEIAEANGIENPNLINSGQVLKIPVSTPGPNPAFTHVVQPGETLRVISQFYGVPWSSIASANNLPSPYFIHPGQSLVIPSS